MIWDRNKASPKMNGGHETPARPRGTLLSVPKIFSVSQNSVSQGI